MRVRLTFVVLGALLPLIYLHPGIAQTLTIPYVSLAGTQLPLFIGETGGIFKKHRLDVQLIYIPGGSLIIQSMLSGQVDVASLAPSNGISAWAKGADIALVAGGIDRLNHMLMVSPSIRRPEGLKGRRLGISRYGSLTDLAVREALRIHGLSPHKDVAIVQLGGLGERVAALAAGTVDGVVVQADQMFQLEKLGFPVLIDLRKLDFSYPTQGLLASREFIRTRRDQVVALVRAYVEGIKVLKSQPELTMTVLAKYLKISDREILSKTYEVYRNVFETLPYTNKNVLLQAVRSMPEFADTPKLNLDAFIDNTIMRELESEGFFKSLYPDRVSR